MRMGMVLAGHGSHISPQTAGLVWSHVDALRARGIADEVTAGFWKEAPALSIVVNSLTAEDVTIVPLFTAAGYFTRTVIPAEMGLDGGVTRRDGRTLRYARAIGEHPYISGVVRRRVESALFANQLKNDEVGVAVIGHGTKRDPASRSTTFEQADALAELGIVKQAAAVFLDDAPSIPDMYDLLDTPTIIAVPNFLALGSHTTIDVPGAIGLPPGATSGIVRGKSVIYTEPVGLDESLTEAIIDLAREAGMPPRGEAVGDGFPVAGRDALIRQVREQGEVRFGQLTLTEREVRAGDAGGALIEGIGTLREWVRTQPHFRPLATTKDLPRGWRCAITQPEQLHQVVETVYPGAVADWAGHFEQRTLADVVARQTGQYRALGSLTGAQVGRMVAKVCAGCVRHPTWFTGKTAEGAIPCAEPCNVWMSMAVKIESY